MAIPLGARIVFVADAWDAMTTERVYGERRSEEEALQEVERVSGAQFDPAVVEALQATAREAALEPTAARAS
jgi:HD-GYP domain-containing protein (c-di-GMP phosphodiesterase class II)